MPLITATKPQSFEKTRLQVPADLMADIQDYCREFSIANAEDFFIEAARYILKMDKDWKKKK